MQLSAYTHEFKINLKIAFPIMLGQKSNGNSVSRLTVHTVGSKNIVITFW